MKKNRVTVIVPVHNGAKYIERCIESILNQSYKDIDILIINDNSTDATMDIVNKYLKLPSIKLIVNAETLGPAKTRNLGLKEVRACEKISVK